MKKCKDKNIGNEYTSLFCITKYPISLIDPKHNYKYE